jgi:hypothetical protein
MKCINLRATARHWSIICGLSVCGIVCAVNQAGVVPVTGPSPSENFASHPSPPAASDSNQFRDLLWPQGVSANLDIASPDLGKVSGDELKAGDSVTPSVGPAKTTTKATDPASAIPLPPAVESGLAGILALALAGLYKPIRRALRF